MNKSNWIPVAAAVLILAGLGEAIGKNSGGPGRNEPGRLQNAKPAPETGELYRRECGSCHFAYPPSFLPAASWRKIMSGLSDHFGDNADLGPEAAEPLGRYLDAQAADRSDERRSVKITRSLAGKDAPLRLTEVPYIRRKHHELSKKHIEDNPKVRSLSHCDACHNRAEQGSFRESEIKIPGYGRWDD